MKKTVCGMTKKGLEDILSKPVLLNTTHKAALREKLFGEKTEIDLDDLARVVGGLYTDHLSLTDWQNLPGESVK